MLPPTTLESTKRLATVGAKLGIPASCTSSRIPLPAITVLPFCRVMFFSPGLDDTDSTTMALPVPLSMREPSTSKVVALVGLLDESVHSRTPVTSPLIRLPASTSTRPPLTCMPPPPLIATASWPMTVVPARVMSLPPKVAPCPTPSIWLLVTVADEFTGSPAILVAAKPAPTVETIRLPVMVADELTRDRAGELRPTASQLTVAPLSSTCACPSASMAWVLAPGPTIRAPSLRTSHASAVSPGSTV